MYNVDKERGEKKKKDIELKDFYNKKFYGIKKKKVSIKNPIIHKNK